MIDLKKEIEELEALRGKYHIVFPAYITHIRFPRYKNMASGARIDFDFPITALVGANGSGKTSVLNALYGAPKRQSTGEYWFSTKVDPIEEGEGSPNRFIYGHYSAGFKKVVETRKARVRKFRNGRDDPNYWEPTKESPGDGMVVPSLEPGKNIQGRSLDRWNPVTRKVLYINFRKELSAFDKYFYFGKNPAIEAARATAAAKKAGKVASGRRILTKMDQVRLDAGLLARVIASGNTSEKSHNRKIATENRLLAPDELKVVSFILGRDYIEARWIRHRLFKGDGGISIVFKTEYGRYSEAFAGSGEVAVASCVVQVLNEKKKGTLLLLDEPEVSLHPGAQERLLAFLAQTAKRKQMQIVFSTHSPHLISALPNDAIKTFHQLQDGAFSIISSTHPYAAFRRLGATHGGKVLVIVEDRLAKLVVQQALALIEDEATRQLFRVEFVSGGASSILNTRIPVFMESSEHIFVLLDGDQKKIDQIQDPDEIPEAQNNQLGQKISAQIGANPELNIDGGSGGGNHEQRIASQRKYLAWVRRCLNYIPTSCPEELVLLAAGKMLADQVGNAPKCKVRLQAVATEALGREAGSEETDRYGEFLLATNRAKSKELAVLTLQLTAFLAAIRAQ
ncbi:AAA family ATPase [Dyella nitratireducens]|uniref:ATPase n=1 Tax=Dyella nitratireducens TaxID=1849580 RepID=A0ABQ1FM02_9GAMM|nr:ATP-binding protein [Dyella nitratireducens]GGA19296.1 ATPase [Dyella nitratireducens]GLQ44529.1 ATPase [Dyella nitratireducens]